MGTAKHFTEHMIFLSLLLNSYFLSMSMDNVKLYLKCQIDLA